MIAATKAAGLSPIHSLNHNKPIQPTICADIGWYNFIATWGISVMEPWERIFALSLMAAFVALMGVALVKLPSCVGI
ncbi:hypothetical protein [Sporisorium scitamineum]|uniref:Uncharacterized protein n=1 Tax=Sporisorium scitamineum TaxID=49012 RepID=A0A0F7S4V8_9BASI|nr:hypothetical protein [Sporisorium scitamineum]